jgi:integrase
VTRRHSQHHRPAPIPVSGHFLFIYGREVLAMARGHVYRRRLSDGRMSKWHAVIDLPKGGDGTRRQVTRTFSTRATADTWLAGQDLNNQSGPTVGEWLEVWVERQALLRPSTQLAYAIHIRRHLIPALGLVPLSAVTPADVEEMIGALASRGLSGGSIERIVATLRGALSAAVRDGLLASNPVAGVRLPSVVPARPAPWSADQARRLLAHAGGVMGVLVRLAVATGMRRGELLALTWNDIDLDAGSVHVHRARVQVGSRVVAGPPKSRAGQRTIWLDHATTHTLTEWKAVQPSTASGLVFADLDGVALIPWEVSREFTRMLHRFGLPVIRLHDLRHLSARLGLASGEPLPAVSERLGHSTITTTARYYGRTAPSVAQASAIRLASLINPDAA